MEGVSDWMRDECWSVRLVVISGVAPSSGMEAPVAEMEGFWSTGWKSGRKTYPLKMWPLLLVNRGSVDRKRSVLLMELCTDKMN